MKSKYTVLLFAYVASGFLITSKSQEKVETLEEVVVTGTGTEHLLRDVPVQTEIVSRKTLDSYAISHDDITNGGTLVLRKTK